MSAHVSERVCVVIEFTAQDLGWMPRVLDVVREMLAARGIEDVSASMHLQEAAERIVRARDG